MRKLRNRVGTESNLNPRIRERTKSDLNPSNKIETEKEVNLGNRTGMELMANQIWIIETKNQFKVNPFWIIVVGESRNLVRTESDLNPETQIVYWIWIWILGTISDLHPWNRIGFWFDWSPIGSTLGLNRICVLVQGTKLGLNRILVLGSSSQIIYWF